MGFGRCLRSLWFTQESLNFWGAAIAGCQQHRGFPSSCSAAATGEVPSSRLLWPMVTAALSKGDSTTGHQICCGSIPHFQWSKNDIHEFVGWNQKQMQTVLAEVSTPFCPILGEVPPKSTCTDDSIPFKQRISTIGTCPYFLINTCVNHPFPISSYPQKSSHSTMVFLGRYTWDRTCCWSLATLLAPEPLLHRRSPPAAACGGFGLGAGDCVGWAENGGESGKFPNGFGGGSMISSGSLWWFYGTSVTHDRRNPENLTCEIAWYKAWDQVNLATSHPPCELLGRSTSQTWGVHLEMWADGTGLVSCSRWFSLCRNLIVIRSDTTYLWEHSTKTFEMEQQKSGFVWE